MKIGPVDLDESVLVIAEIGNNHEGDLNVAKEMIATAASAGADAVKFQMIDPSKLVARSEEARRAQLTRFRLAQDDFLILARAAEKHGVAFLCTPFDLDAVRFLNPLVPAFKISSGDNDFTALLEVVARTGKPILMSTGLADIALTSRSKDLIERVWREIDAAPGLALLHCVSAYPVTPDQAELKSIQRLMSLGVTVGYSDHTIGIEAPVLAVGAGARVIEKHFTLDNEFSDFRDHALSADPASFRRMVDGIRMADRFRGRNGGGSEDPQARVAARRSIAAAHDLREGHVLRLEDLTWLRPGTGFRPGEEELVIGRELARPVMAGKIIERDDMK